MKRSSKALIALIFLLSLLPLFSFAVFRWEIEYPWEPPRPGNLPEYLLYIYKFAIWGSGILAMLMIIIGGVLYMIASATEDPEMKKDARDRIKMALLGLVLILGTYVILHTINPELTIAQLPRIRIVPDKSCRKFCHSECQRRCDEKIEVCLEKWKEDIKHCPLKPEEEKEASLICADSCVLTCRPICQYVCAKNYWEWKCEEINDKAAEIWGIFECKTRGLALSSRSCLRVCAQRKAVLVNCSSCCFRGIFAPITTKDVCPPSSLEAYIKTCEELKERR